MFFIECLWVLWVLLGQKTTITGTVESAHAKKEIWSWQTGACLIDLTWLDLLDLIHIFVFQFTHVYTHSQGLVPTEAQEALDSKRRGVFGTALGIAWHSRALASCDRRIPKDERSKGIEEGQACVGPRKHNMTKWYKWYKMRKQNKYSIQNKCDVHCEVPLQTTFGKIHRTVSLCTAFWSWLCSSKQQCVCQSQSLDKEVMTYTLHILSWSWL